MVNKWYTDISGSLTPTKKFSGSWHAADINALSWNAKPFCVLFFCWSQWKRFGKEVNYFLHPQNIQKTIISSLKWINHTLEKRTTCKSDECTGFYFKTFVIHETVKVWSWTSFFSPMHTNEGFYNHAVFVRGLANLQFGGLFYCNWQSTNDCFSTITII